MAGAPEDPDALTLLGRIARAERNLALSIGFHRLALRLAPDNAQAAADLELATAAVPSPREAERLYRQAVDLEPDIACHHRPLGATLPFLGMDRVEALLRAALLLDPSHARAHAALGNVQARRSDRGEAVASYALALMLDWTFADAHLAIAQFHDDADRVDLVAQHYREALSRKVLYEAPARDAVRKVLVLKAPGGFPANGLPDYCIDPSRSSLCVYYVTPDAASLPELRDYDVVFSAIGETERHAASIARAIELLGSAGVDVINHPSLLPRVRRPELAAVLKGAPDCVIPASHRFARDDPPDAAGFPVLIRPVDTHRGDGLELLRTPDDLAAYLQHYPDQILNVTSFVDYRDPDGYYRKYRVVLVDGEAFPYHLAISNTWLVHYWRAVELMCQNPWMLAEEERFLRDPRAVFPSWDASFRAVAEAIGFELFAVDCARLPDGRILVFECDPCAFIQCREAPDNVLSYKYDYVPRIFAALDELLSARATKARTRRG